LLNYARENQGLRGHSMPSTKTLAVLVFSVLVSPSLGELAGGSSLSCTGTVRCPFRWAIPLAGKQGSELHVGLWSRVLPFVAHACAHAVSGHGSLERSQSTERSDVSLLEGWCPVACLFNTFECNPHDA
jgi:hypothetical protein